LTMMWNTHGRPRQPINHFPRTDYTYNEAKNFSNPLIG
jgi:hypothetical protein